MHKAQQTGLTTVPDGDTQSRLFHLSARCRVAFGQHAAKFPSAAGMGYRLGIPNYGSSSEATSGHFMFYHIDAKESRFAVLFAHRGTFDNIPLIRDEYHRTRAFEEHQRDDM